MAKDRDKKSPKIGGQQRQHQKTASTGSSSSAAPGTPAAKVPGSPKPSPPRSDSQFTGYNSPHPVLRIYSSPPAASASTSNANATGRIDFTFEDSSSPTDLQSVHGSRRNSSTAAAAAGKSSSASKAENRPRKSSTESLRRHIAGQPQNSSPLAQEGPGSPKAASSPRSPTQALRTSSSSSSSSLSSMAGPDTPDYMNGLRLHIKNTTPVPPVIASDIAFPTMDTTLPHLSSARLSPAQSIESLKSCMREPRESTASLHVADSFQSPEGDSPGGSPSTRKRRSVSFAVEDPVVHHLQPTATANGANGSLSLTNGSGALIPEDGPVPFPTEEHSGNSLRRRRPGGEHEDGSAPNSASRGAFFTYMRANTLSTYSSRTSMSSEGWSAYGDEDDSNNDEPSCLRKWTETAVGLSLAVGWLAIGKIVGIKGHSEGERRAIQSQDPHEYE